MDSGLGFPRGASTLAIKQLGRPQRCNPAEARSTTTRSYLNPASTASKGGAESRGRLGWQITIRVSELVFTLFGFVLIGRHSYEGGGSLKLIAI
jgi:hypothetical protein